MNNWSTIYNFFGCLILIFLVMILYRDIRVNEKQFEELKLRTALDYATEASFVASLQGGNLGISYEDLQNLRIDPSNVLSTFKQVLAMNYDIALTDANLDALDEYISTAVVAVSDGYYIASLTEVDTPALPQRGGEYKLKWSMKKPYIVPYTGNQMTVTGQTPDKYIAFNLSTEQWVMTRIVSGAPQIVARENFHELTEFGIFYDSEKIRQQIIQKVNQQLTDDINYTIDQRNKMYRHADPVDFIYLPSQTTASGVNPITKPTVFFTLTGVDFAGTSKLEAKSVGGYTVGKKRRVLAFVKNGVNYYCYESQLPSTELNLVVQFYNTVDEAALAGYRPHVDYLKNPLSS